MKTVCFVRFLAGITIVTALSIVAASCGGSGGGNGGGGGRAFVVEIRVQGIAAPVFTNGVPPQPVCPVGSSINSRVSIRFNGPVDIASVPASTQAAAGSIQIVDVATNQAATGLFSIDPNDPTTVFFTALPPTNPANPCTAGFLPASTYTIFVPDNSSGQSQVITIGGVPLTQAVLTCFTTVQCPGPGSLTDPIPGPPCVLSTTPTADSTAPMTTLSQIEGAPGQSVITIDINEPLNPTTVNANTILVLNTTRNAGGPVPAAGTVLFTQLGLIPGLNASRITFTTFVPLADGDTYQIDFAGVLDLGGNALNGVLLPQCPPPDPNNPPAGEPLMFSIQDENDDNTVTLFDDFNDTSNRGALTGAIQWDGSGRVSATFPLPIVGDGMDGMLTLDTSMTINTDNQRTNNDPARPQGVWNLTDLVIGDPITPGVTITFTSTTNTPPLESNFAPRFRTINGITIHDTAIVCCNGRAGTDTINPPVQASANSNLGGAGGPGGGKGGDGSSTTGGPSPTADNGEGGHIDAVDPTLPGGESNINPTNPLFGGGGGGTAGTASNFMGGGAGGGGGTASSFGGYVAGETTCPDPSNPGGVPADQYPATFLFNPSTAGETWRGTDNMGGGAPAAGTAGPIPAAMVPPLDDTVGGSGGGGGGDRVISATNQNPGPGGGGGGGGLRFSSAGMISFGNAAEIHCRGGQGGEGVGFFIGQAAGGSGGSIVVQTFDLIVLGTAVTFDCAGGPPNGGTPITPTDPSNPVTFDGDGGFGGDGVIQLADVNGAFATPANFGTLFTVVNGEICAGQFALSGDVPGTASSRVIDTMSPAVRYTTSAATVNPGPTGMIMVQVTGIAEDPNNPGNPATTVMGPGGFPLMAGPVDPANVSMLNGYRYFRFDIDTMFPAPPVTQVNDPLPFAEDFTITYIQ